MIRNQWYAVLDSKEVKKGKLLYAKRLGESLVFYRKEDNDVGVVFDRCAHRGASLSKGKIKDNCIECPFHGFRYNDDGKCVLIPANGKSAEIPEYFKVNSYKAVDKYGLIWIWWGEKRDIYPPLPFFDDIGGEMSYVTFKYHWKVHYSRAVENQLDLVHLPFVHYNSIGRGNKTLVNGPLVKAKEEDLKFWVYNREDNGEKPIKPEEIIAYFGEPKEKSQHIHFRFPNIWQNWIIEKFRVFIAFVPVDEENTILYMRNYQSFNTLPIIGKFIDLLGMGFSIYIASQDKRVVETQIPIKTSLKMDEKLIQGDLPIIMYRKKRDELQSGR